MLKTYYVINYCKSKSQKLYTSNCVYILHQLCCHFQGIPKIFLNRYMQLKVCNICDLGL